MGEGAHVGGWGSLPTPPSSQSQGTGARGAFGGALPPSASLALQRIEKAAEWAEVPSGWARAPWPEVEKYEGALSVLAEVCSSPAARDALLRWDFSPRGPSQEEGSLREPHLLQHFCRVFCAVCSARLSEVGIDYGGPSCRSGDPAGTSKEAPGASGAPSAEEWLGHGQSLLEAMRGPSRRAIPLRRLVLLLYPLTSCLCGSRLSVGAAALLQTPEGAHCLSLLAAVAAAATEEEAKSLPASAAAATPRETSERVAATETPSSATRNNTNSISNSSSSSGGDSSLLLALLGAYEGLLALQGIAAAARGGPLRSLHRAVQRGAARLLGKAASLPDSAIAVLAWLVYRRLSSSSSTNDGSFSATNVRHLLALLIASVRNHLRRPLEQRVSALCLREAIKEPRLHAALAGPTHDAALAFVAVCLQSLQALAVASETAAKEALRLSSCDAAAAERDRQLAVAERDRQLVAAAPICEMLALLCATSASVRAAVAARLDALPPPVHLPSASTSSTSSSAGRPTEQQPQQQQQHPYQTHPGRGRSSAALSAASLPALFYIAAKGDELGCTYTCAFLELCVSGQGARGIGRHFSLQQREEAVAALAANTDLLPAAAASPELVGSSQEAASLRGAACLSLLAALWDGTEALGSAVETVCLLPISAEAEEAAQRGDTVQLMRMLQVSLDFTACTRRHLPRTLRLLQRAGAALAAGPLSSPQTAAEAEEALLLVYKCCALSRPTPWRQLQPISHLLVGAPCFSATAGAAEATAVGAGSARGDLLQQASDAEQRRCPLLARLDGLLTSAQDVPWGFSCRPLATAMAEESRRHREEMRELQHSNEEAKQHAAQVAQRLAVTNDAHEVELSQLRGATERLQRLHAAEEQRLAKEVRKLQTELEAEQKRGRDLVVQFQRLLDAKESTIASLQSTLGKGRNPDGVDASEVSRDLQIQTAINVKQKEELLKQEGKLHALIEKQQQTANSLALLNGKHRQLQEENAKLQLANEKAQEESEQQFRQLILVMKALAEQQAENETLKEERLHSSVSFEEHRERRVQQLEQQLQQMTRDQESAASAASLRLVSLEEKLRAFQKENESLKVKCRRTESAVEEMEQRLREAAEAVASANAATAAKAELVRQMEKELKEKESRLAVISAALRGS